MAVKARYAPGPWNVVPVFAGYAINGHRIYAGDEIVARTCAKDEGYDEANARLIAAAPVLLLVLSGLLATSRQAIASGYWKVDGACDPDIDFLRADAIIAKVLGERQ